MKTPTETHEPPKGKLLAFPGVTLPAPEIAPTPAHTPPAPPPPFATADEEIAPYIPIKHPRIPPLRRRQTRPKYFDVFDISGRFDELTRILELCKFRYLLTYVTVQERKEVWRKLAAEAARARRIPCLVFLVRGRRSVWMPTPLLGLSGAGNPPIGVTEATAKRATEILRKFPPGTAALIANGSL